MLNNNNTDMFYSNKNCWEITWDSPVGCSSKYKQLNEGEFGRKKYSSAQEDRT